MKYDQVVVSAALFYYIRNAQITESRWFLIENVTAIIHFHSLVVLCASNMTKSLIETS